MAIAADKNRIMIYGPKPDGTYVVEFRTSGGADHLQAEPERLDDPLLVSEQMPA
jgi:hypothetical protein